jgi:vancomycin aglycone glucosyltransferase
MRALWTTYGSRGDVQPLVGLAVQLGALGAELRVCAPPDFAELLTGVGVPRAAELVVAQFDTVAAAAEECDAPGANGVMPTGVWR